MTSIDEAVRVRELLRMYNDPNWHAGSAEPWVAELVYSLVIACDAKHAIEVGSFEGYTSKRIARALLRLPHETLLTVCEIDQERANATDALLGSIYAGDYAEEYARYKVVCDNSLRWLPTLGDASVDFAWIDGDHEKEHVAQELTLLWPKMRNNGLICLHDVFGVCDLKTIVAAWDGYSLDLPRLGPAGGLGIVQVRT